MYPTLMEDTNGNQVIVVYGSGSGASWTNSSSRVQSVEDVRSSAPGVAVYTFNYQGSRLTGVTNWLGSGESYTFAQNTAGLNSPFGGGAFPSANLLTSLTEAVSGQTSTFSLTTRFTYNGNGTGELTEVTTPYQGFVRWDYSPVTLQGQRAVRLSPSFSSNANGLRFWG